MSFQKNRKEIRRERQMDYTYVKDDDENPQTKKEAAALENIRRLDHEEVAERVKNAYLEMTMGVVEGRLPVDSYLIFSPEGHGLILSDVVQSRGLKIENRRAVRRRTIEHGVVGPVETNWAEGRVFKDSICTGWHHSEHGKLTERDAP